MTQDIDVTEVFEWNYNALFNRSERFIENIGGSRCHAPGTLIRMANGRLKKVEDIIIGDRVASYDGKGYNTVVDTHSGVDDMYLIKQGKGEDYIVNKNHILAVKQTRHTPYKIKGKEYYDKPYCKETIHYFNAEEWSKMSLRRRRNYSGFKDTFLELPEQDLSIDPYYLGLWLGDGTSRVPTAITTEDKEIIDYLNSVKEKDTFLDNPQKYVYKIRSNSFNKQTELSKAFYKEDLVNNKHIPEQYLYSSYEQRLQLLAGLIDSDGHQSKRNTLLFSNINKGLVEAVYELLLITGFYSNGVNSYVAKMKREDGSIYTVDVYSVEFNSKDFSDLNKYLKLERKKVKRIDSELNMFNTKIESVYIGKGEFYGFTLDKCPLYKLKDGTITHNSSKTVSVAQIALIYGLEEPNKEITICRKTLKALTRTFKKDLEFALKQFNLGRVVKHNKSNHTYELPNGSVIELMGADDPDKLRGSKRDLLILDECNELGDEEFLQLNIRTTDRVIYMYNPSHERKWMKTIPEEDKISIHSTYLNNPFLTEVQKAQIENLKETDEAEYTIYCLGKKAISRLNVFSNWERLDKRPVQLDKFVYAMDFGYSAPCTLVKIWYCDDDESEWFNKVYIEELIYTAGLNTDDLIAKMKDLEVDEYTNIICDHASPLHIDELRKAGYSAIKANKDVQKGLGAVRRKKVYVCSKADNVWTEYENYKYKKIGDFITDEPIKELDHTLDPIRYGILYIQTITNYFKV